MAISRELEDIFQKTTANVPSGACLTLEFAITRRVNDTRVVEILSIGHYHFTLACASAGECFAIVEGLKIHIQEHLVPGYGA